MLPVKTILYPTDFSENARHAIPHLLEVAKCFSAQIHLLHVVETSLQVADVSWSAAQPEMDTRIHEAAKERLEKLAEEIGLPKERLSLAVVDGHPSLEITRYAKAHEIDMIVMSTHGHSGLSHFLLGSVTERVVRKASCPVLTVRADLDEDES
ncbi:MAG TPA: universal stress protein [Candidatus Krumholzibacteria bacterium]|nr:universal stress protein [Candidatus Krumholzibacteria bacterium]